MSVKKGKKKERERENCVTVALSGEIYLKRLLVLYSDKKGTSGKHAVY